MKNRLKKIDSSKIREKSNTKGEVLLQLRDSTGMITKKVLGNNALSKVAKARVVFKGSEFLDGGSAFMMGKTFISNDINAAWGINGAYRRAFKTLDRQTAIVLLNLTGKTTTDNYIPIYDVTGNLDRNVVIGWFNTNTDVTGDDYLGLDMPNVRKGLFSGISREKLGYFDKLKANGTITHVAVMNGIGKPGAGNAEFQGAIAWQNLCKELVNSTWCPPNTPGITGADEIAIFNVSTGVEAYKINLETGAEIKTDLTKAAIGWNGTDVRKASLLFDTNKLAVVDGDACKILQINGDGTVTELMSKRLIYGSINDVYGIFIHNGYLYFTAGQDGKDSTYNIARMLKVSLSNLSTGTEIANKDSAIIGGLPSGWNINQINVLAYHNNKFYIQKNGLDGNTKINDRQNDIIVCTDLLDITGSICGTLTNETKGLSVISTTNKQNIFIGRGLKQYVYINGEMRYVNELQEYTYTKALTDTVAVNRDLFNSEANNSMVWMSENYGSWWTLFPLTEPIVKTDTDTLDVIYNISWKDI